MSAGICLYNLVFTTLLGFMLWYIGEWSQSMQLVIDESQNTNFLNQVVVDWQTMPLT